VSGKMNWDRVNRENRAWREAKRTPSGGWEPDYGGLESYNSPEVDRWLRAEPKRRRPTTDTTNTKTTIQWGMATSGAAQRRRRRRKRAQTERHQVRVR
jgi:hypothetical protein